MKRIAVVSIVALLAGWFVFRRPARPASPPPTMSAASLGGNDALQEFTPGKKLSEDPCSHLHAHFSPRKDGGLDRMETRGCPSGTRSTPMAEYSARFAEDFGTHSCVCVEER
jgi:hypothetical protein